MESSAAEVHRALTAAHLYYVQDRTMESIARELRTSRSTVSRLLARARATGIVDIRIHSPFDSADLLERQLARRFGARFHIVPVPADADETDRRDRVARAAAHRLSEVLHSDTVAGIAWGSTIAAVSRYLVPQPLHGTTFVQLNGSGNTKTTGLLYASEILGRFAGAYGGVAEQFPVPAFFDDPLTKRAMWRERSTRRVLALQERMQIVMFSVGSSHSPVPSHVYADGYLEATDLASLASDGVVGDVATVFYRGDGSSDGIALNERATGPAFDVLRGVPMRLCVVAGASKVTSLRGALRARLATDVLIDESSARVLADAESGGAEHPFADME